MLTCQNLIMTMNHTYFEANQVADWLAKSGTNGTIREYHDYQSIPEARACRPLREQVFLHYIGDESFGLGFKMSRRE